MLDGLQNTMSSLEQFDFGQELEEIVETHKDDLAVLQRAQWGDSSQDRNGNEISLNGRGYSPFTVRIKEQFGQGLGAITDRITNYQTGALYQGLTATVENGEFILRSDVSYFDELMSREGEAEGLSEEYRQIFADEITLPEITRILREKTGFEIT
jgi:hypothetical protein